MFSDVRLKPFSGLLIKISVSYASYMKMQGCSLGNVAIEKILVDICQIEKCYVRVSY